MLNMIITKPAVLSDNVHKKYLLSVHVVVTGATVPVIHKQAQEVGQ